MTLVKKLVLKFGASSAHAKLELEPTGITLFVGPNNAGKSLVLREIEKYCASEQKLGNLVLDSIEFSFPDLETILKDLKARKTEPNQGENVPDGAIVVQRINTYQGHRPREIVPLNQIADWLRGNSTNALTRYYISLLTIRLDGATRTTLLNPNTRADLLESPTNLLSALWVDDPARRRIRELTAEAFGKYFTIDALNSNQLRARLSDRPPMDESEEQALDLRARSFHRSALEITEASDGVKAFTGMVAAVLGQNCKIPLIDEPEAFLHPPLARRLGKELAEAASKLKASAFIATHSSHFLMGCVAGSPRVNIVRLTYKGGQATARLLRHEQLQEIIKSPLMRSTGVLSALFHEGAVVCEGDSDRALYEEINSRLAAEDQRQSAEAIFINAHTKQSTAKVAGPLRQMGIPAAIIVDFDIFNSTEDFKYMLRDLGIPSALAQGWCQTKSLLVQKLDDLGVDSKKFGLSAVTDADTMAGIKSLMTALKEYGIFVVPNGELESWLAPLGVTTSANKKYWLTSVFELLGDDPTNSNYIKPAKSDIWQFLVEIASWINNPARAGV